MFEDKGKASECAFDDLSKASDGFHGAVFVALEDL